ncbi:DUF4976 domain-containing protein [Thalassotalea sp. HSM 43]|uniref:sulfatase n=1 Tax=Thalassotalea sp. HSM 43 TaxID=2552945 RepID=UPI001082148A|nr:sulfatase [Thalassotalea sp. HSM 43]QBY04214.1 DUF4976 domain-containing protein [Thalassotalea sp. HSM 43]
MFRYLCTLFCLFLLGISSTSAASDKTTNLNKKDKRPNVILIVVDDLNDYQGIFAGHSQVQTPNIDKLAASGSSFINAQSNIPVCQPSRNSLFTGVYPHVSQDFGWTKQHKQPVLKHNKTLQELFAENGYQTMGTGKLMHGGKTELWQEWGMPHKHDYGPLYFNGDSNGASPNVASPFADIGAIDGAFGRLSVAKSSGKRNQPGWVYGWDKKPFRYISDDDRDLMQDEKHAQWASEQLKTLAQAENQAPFFMGIGFVRPHTPLYAPDKYFDMYPLEDIDLSHWLPDDQNDTFFQNNFPTDGKGLRYYRTLLQSFDGDRELALKHFLQAYLACITFMDAQLGKVLTALERHPQLNDNTVIVFTSDHGWQMGEKGYLFKNSPWEESARIPMIVRTPDNTKQGQKISQPVSLIDIFPTLVDYANLSGNHKKNDKAGDLGGHSLRPLIDADTMSQWQGPKGALSVVGNYGNSGKKWQVEQQNYSYRTERFRYIRYSNGEAELYDHEQDPYEWHNQAKNEQYQQVINDLRQQVNNLLQTTL